MVFANKSRWNVIFLALFGKMIFLFPEDMILPLWQEMRDNISKKIYGKMIFCSNILKRWYFQKNALEYDLSCIIWKDRIFLAKRWSFFFGRKLKDDLSEEMHGNMIFSVCTCRCHKHDIVPLSQKKSKIIFSCKNAPKCDWHSRLTF